MKTIRVVSMILCENCGADMYYHKKGHKRRYGLYFCDAQCLAAFEGPKRDKEDDSTYYDGIYYDSLARDYWLRSENDW